MLNPIDSIYAKARRVGQLLGLPTVGIEEFATTEFTEEEKNASDLHRLFYGHQGPVVHKWKHYLSVYHRHLAQYRGTPVRLLEIGVFKGGSLHLWREYFGAEATIFGVDIDPSCASLGGRAAQVRIGSQDDPDFLAAVVKEMGGVDVVIDDGSHVCPHQVASFRYLFPQLAEPGVYICEDLHTNYWRGYHQGGFRRASTFIETSKEIVDDLNSCFHSDGSNLQSEFSILGIHFYNSMVVIDKGTPEQPAHIQIGST